MRERRKRSNAKVLIAQKRVYLLFYCRWFLLFSCSVTKLCLTLCDLMDCSMPGFPVLHYLSESAQTHVHWEGDTIQPPPPAGRKSLSFLYPISCHCIYFLKVKYSFKNIHMAQLYLSSAFILENWKYMLIQWPVCKSS